MSWGGHDPRSATPLLGDSNSWGGMSQSGGYGQSFWVPDELILMTTPGVQQTDSGYITNLIEDNESYVPTGDIYACYSYLATGRFFSTSTTPMEYGDGDVYDPLLVHIYYKDIPKKDLEKLVPGAVVGFTRNLYTGKNALYRLVTGNPYESHLEYKIIPIMG